MQVLEAVEGTLRIIKDTVAPASMGQRKRGSSGSADSSIDDSGSGAAGKHPTKSSRAAKDDSFTTEDAVEEADAVFDQLYEDNMLWDERVRIDKPPAAMKGVIKEVSQPVCCCHSLAASLPGNEARSCVATACCPY